MLCTRVAYKTAAEEARNHIKPYNERGWELEDGLSDYTAAGTNTQDHIKRLAVLAATLTKSAKMYASYTYMVLPDIIVRTNHKA